MNYNAEQLLEDIIKEIDWIMSVHECIPGNWHIRCIEYMIDLYWCKFGINLRLTNLKVGDFIRWYHEIYG